MSWWWCFCVGIGEIEEFTNKAIEVWNNRFLFGVFRNLISLNGIATLWWGKDDMISILRNRGCPPSRKLVWNCHMSLGWVSLLLSCDFAAEFGMVVHVLVNDLRITPATLRFCGQEQRFEAKHAHNSTFVDDSHADKPHIWWSVWNFIQQVCRSMPSRLGSNLTWFIQMIYLPGHFSSDLRPGKTTKIQTWCSSPPSISARYPDLFVHVVSVFVHILMNCVWGMSNWMLLGHPIPFANCWLGCCYPFGVLHFTVYLWISLRIYRYMIRFCLTSTSPLESCNSIWLIFSGLRVQFPPSQGFRGLLQLPPTAWAVNLYRKSCRQFCYRKYQHAKHGIHEYIYAVFSAWDYSHVIWMHFVRIFKIFEDMLKICKDFQAWSESKGSLYIYTYEYIYIYNYIYIYIYIPFLTKTNNRMLSIAWTKSVSWQTWWAH